MMRFEGRADEVAKTPLAPVPRALLNETANVFKLLSDPARLGI